MTPRKGSVIYFLIAGAIIGYFMQQSPAPVPDLPNTWWGRNDTDRPVDQSIRQFRITFPEKVVDDLKLRLKNTRLTKAPQKETGSYYGVTNEFVSKLTDYWLNKYDFKTREKHLNQYPHFITNIQGLDIHFLRAKPVNPGNKKVLPLLIVHGWPGSVVEFYKLIPLLIKTPTPEHDFVFDVIIPSLPGFGFSEPAVRSGLGPAQMAVIFKNLMLKLGYDKFYIQGGDWGAEITADMASMFPQHVLGMHSNMCLVLTRWSAFKTLLYSIYPSLLLPQEDHHLMYPLSTRLSKIIQITGYLHLQATKPDTLGVAITDSPAGLAAYIVEKFSDSVNPTFTSGKEYDFLKKFSIDEIIDNLMFYWVPNSMTTAARIYAEYFSNEHRSLNMHSVPVKVPSACAQFPRELAYQPESFLKDRFTNLVHVKKMHQGGHFAALEEPKLLADEIWTSIEKMETLEQNTQS